MEPNSSDTQQNLWSIHRCALSCHVILPKTKQCRAQQMAMWAGGGRVVLLAQWDTWRHIPTNCGWWAGGGGGSGTGSGGLGCLVWYGCPVLGSRGGNYEYDLIYQINGSLAQSVVSTAWVHSLFIRLALHWEQIGNLNTMLNKFRRTIRTYYYSYRCENASY